jgi:two-component system, sensor histidine kinase YesM
MDQKSTRQFGFRMILLTYGICITAVIVAVAFFLFTRLYSVINDMEDCIDQYVTLDNAGRELQQAKMSFILFFDTIKSGSVGSDDPAAELEQASATAAYHRYRARLDIMTMPADYERSHEQYFLNRGIVNGLEYLDEISSQIEKDKNKVSPQTYGLYYQALKVFDYLHDYTSNLYIATAVKDNITISLSSMQYIQKLKYLSIIALLIIMTVSISAVFGITRYLNCNVVEVMNAADAITEEKFDNPDLLLVGPREFIVLKDKMNSMKHRLKERHDLEKKLHRQELEQEQTSRELEKARYLSLQAQIDPHFLFNTLNVISHTALFENASGTVKLINSLASVFRYRLEFKNEVTLADEITFVREYLEIQQARFGERLKYKLDDSARCKDFTIPPFVIQPFVENAVRHGIEPKETGGTVTVAISRGGDSIHVIIEDDGVGVPEHFALPQRFSESQHHIGIANVVNRLAMYFSNDFCVSINRVSKEGGTRVDIVMPVARKVVE